jgi:hypothetical protein
MCPSETLHETLGAEIQRLHLLLLISELTPPYFSFLATISNTLVLHI